MRTRFQLIHMITGVLIAGLLGIHMIVLHLNTILGFFGSSSLNPISWASMIERAREAVWTGIYVALLAVVMYHAFYGLRGIAFELTTSPRMERLITRSFIVLGAIIFVWASYVPVVLIMR